MVQVRDDEVKTHYPKITDKYNQVKEFAILIKDVELQLSAYLPELKVGQFEYLNVLSSYGVPRVYLSAADQEILHAQVVRLGDSIDYDIKLTPKKVGTVNLEVSDGEGTVRVVRLVIGEGEEEEEEVVEEEEEKEVEKDISTFEGLDEFLQSLFSQFGVQSMTNEGIETSNAELSSEVKNKINEKLNKKSITQDNINIIKNRINTLDSSNYNNPAFVEGVLTYFTQNLQDRLDGNILHIFKTDYTPEIEDGYIGGFYFKINNPDLVQEAGIEYYNSASSSNANMVWKKEILENEGDGEFASFILPKTKYTLVRGYAKDMAGNISYTDIRGSFMQSEVSLYEYYSIDEALSGQSVDGVETNALPLLAIPVAIFVGSLAIGVVSDYYCELNGGTFYLPSTWTQDNTINFGCAISAGSTIIGVIGLAGAIKTGVTQFSSKATVSQLATQAGKSVDDIARLGIKELPTNIGNVNITYHALDRMLERGITKEMVIHAINQGENFKYLKEGKTLKGFYDSTKNLFVGVGDDGITTVINNVKINYINNLKATIQ